MKRTVSASCAMDQAVQHFFKGVTACFLKGCIIATTLTCSVAWSADAQSIQEDGTLSTQVSSTDDLNFTITDGDRIGNNLFHSFEAFSVPDTGSAVFDNPDSISNIIGRITGNTSSSIEGLIRANGAANLFLINPHGILFEENAQLDIGAASQSIQVNDNGYDFLPTSQAVSLVDGSSGLQLKTGNTFALVANDLHFTGGVIAAPAGQLALGSVQQGLVSLNVDSTAPGRWDLGYERVQNFGDIELSGQSLINASDRLFSASKPFPVGDGTQGGSIALQGRQIALRDGSLALIQSFGSQDSGGIYINARDSIELDGRDRTQNVRSGFSTASLGAGRGGEIEVAAQQLRLINGGGIRSETAHTPGGNISLQISDTIQFDLVSPGQSVSGTVASISFGAGQAGNIDLSTGALTIAGEGISSRNIASGPGGTVTVLADYLSLSHGASIASSVLGIVDPTQGRSFATGPGGNIIINAATIDIIGIDPQTFFPSTITASTTDAGPAGNLTINTQQLHLQNGGRIDASTFSTGNAGTVNITATDTVDVIGRVPNSINPSLIISAANEIDANLRNFFLSQGIVLPALPSGPSGDVTISTPTLLVAEGAQVTVKNDGTGDAGALAINANTVTLVDGAEISASTQQGEGGNLNLTIQESLRLRQGSQISAEAGSMGAGGNISLSVPILVAIENSDIIANAVQGAGGNIQIHAQSILGTEFREQLTAESDITASSQLGVSGIVEIDSLEVTPSSALATLPETVADVSNQIVASCADTGRGQFVATGRGGLPPNPLQRTVAHRPWRDSRAIPNPTAATAANGQVSARSGPPEQSNNSSLNNSFLTEATTWKNNSQGEIVLTSHTAQPSSTVAPSPRCLRG